MEKPHKEITNHQLGHEQKNCETSIQSPRITSTWKVRKLKFLK